MPAQSGYNSRYRQAQSTCKTPGCEFENGHLGPHSHETSPEIKRIRSKDETMSIDEYERRRSPSRQRFPKRRGWQIRTGGKRSKSSVAMSVAALLAFVVHTVRQPAYVAPDAVETHPYHLLEDLWDGAALDGLMAFVRSRNFSSAKTDSTSRLPHLGEGAPSGSPHCDHRMLVPSADGTMCVLPSRLDIAKHFLAYGGPSANKLYWETLASRMQACRRIHPEESTPRWLRWRPRALTVIVRAR